MNAPARIPTCSASVPSAVPTEQAAALAQGISFGTLLASLYAAQGAVGSLDSAFGFIRRAIADDAGSALDIPTLKLLSERLTGLAAAADAAQATIAGRVVRGRS